MMKKLGKGREYQTSDGCRGTAGLRHGSRSCKHIIRAVDCDERMTNELVVVGPSVIRILIS